jgi:hypothetical protein
MSTAAPSRIDRAAAILRDAGDENSWPSSPEARASITWARDYLLGEMDVHARLLDGSMDWGELGEPDLGWCDDPEAEAIAVAGERALDAAEGLAKRLREYQKREAAEA